MRRLAVNNGNHGPTFDKAEDGPPVQAAVIALLEVLREDMNHMREGVGYVIV